MRIDSKHRKELLVVALIVTAVAIVLALWWLLHPRALVTPQIRREANFAIFLPDPSLYGVPRKSFKFDAQTKILSFTTNNLTGSDSYTVTEQTEPEILVDGGQQVYQSFLTSLGEYQDIDTALGRVSLTHPPHLSGQQTAVVSAQQTLIFVKPLEAINANQWQSLFDAFSVSN